VPNDDDDDDDYDDDDDDVGKTTWMTENNMEGQH
jgi:hypothetical protein